MQALVSPTEKVYDYLGNQGSRIAQIEPDDKTFEVAEPLFWTPCPDDCNDDTWWWYESSIQPIPVDPNPQPEQPTEEPTA